MAWTCERTEDQLLDALEGTLEAGQRAEMDAHVAGCAACARLVAGVRQSVESLHRMETAEPAAWLVPKIIERTSGPRPERRRRFAWIDFISQPRFALGAAAVLITFSIVFHTLSSGAPDSLAAISPVQIYRQFDRRAHLAYARGVKFLSDLRVVYEIQSRFQPQTPSEPSPSPEKKSTDQLQRLFYGSLDSRLQPAGTLAQGDQHELRYPS